MKPLTFPNCAQFLSPSEISQAIWGPLRNTHFAFVAWIGNLNRSNRRRYKPSAYNSPSPRRIGMPLATRSETRLTRSGVISIYKFLTAENAESTEISLAAIISLSLLNVAVARGAVHPFHLPLFTTQSWPSVSAIYVRHAGAAIPQRPGAGTQGHSSASSLKAYRPCRSWR
jgi:hypothetical protein